MKTIFSCFILLLSLTTLAGTQKLLTITNDLDKSVATITINDLDGSFQNIHLLESEAGQVSMNVKYNMTQLKQGALIKNQQGRKVLIARLNPNFDSRYGGEFIFDFLSNGLTNSRGKESFDLRKNGDAWEVTKNNKPVTQLRVITRRIMGQTVGISRVESK